MKKLINDPRHVVGESLAGFGAAHSDIVTVQGDPQYVIRTDAPVAGKVALVSGGGSGHEPLHAGFVGKGMLDAAVPGDVFTSPTPDPILAATQAVDSGKGVVHIVKNYTGDVLNFETAAEFAASAGIEVRTVLVEDDVAVQDSLYTAGRRGVAGALVVEKIAGAAAERGNDLEAVASIGTRIASETRSMGVALHAGTVPYAGVPGFEPADAIVDRLLEPIVSDIPFASGDRVLLFVNGMGGTPVSELYILYRRAAQVLAGQGIQVVRSLVGSFVTSLEMQGASITVTRFDDETLALWDAPVHTPALRWGL